MAKMVSRLFICKIVLHKQFFIDTHSFWLRWVKLFCYRKEKFIQQKLFFFLLRYYRIIILLYIDVKNISEKIVK